MSVCEWSGARGTPTQTILSATGRRLSFGSESGGNPKGPTGESDRGPEEGAPIEALTP